MNGPFNVNESGDLCFNPLEFCIFAFQLIHANPENMITTEQVKELVKREQALRRHL